MVDINIAVALQSLMLLCDQLQCCMQLRAKVIDKRVKKCNFLFFYRLLYRMRLDLDTESVYQQGNYSVIATVCCQNKRHGCNFVAVLTCDIFQGQLLITPDEIEHSLYPCFRVTRLCPNADAVKDMK